MDAQHVRYEVEGRVANITLDRPERANAQNERLLDELAVQRRRQQFEPPRPGLADGLLKPALRNRDASAVRTPQSEY